MLLKLFPKGIAILQKDHTSSQADLKEQVPQEVAVASHILLLIAQVVEVEVPVHHHAVTVEEVANLILLQEVQEVQDLARHHAVTVEEAANLILPQEVQEVQDRALHHAATAEVVVDLTPLQEVRVAAGQVLLPEVIVEGVPRGVNHEKVAGVILQGGSSLATPAERDEQFPGVSHQRETTARSDGEEAGRRPGVAPRGGHPRRRK